MVSVLSSRATVAAGRSDIPDLGNAEAMKRHKRQPVAVQDNSWPAQRRSARFARRRQPAPACWRVPQTLR